jgi:hypothetical protein
MIGFGGINGVRYKNDICMWFGENGARVTYNFSPSYSFYTTGSYIHSELRLINSIRVVGRSGHGQNKTERLGLAALLLQLAVPDAVQRGSASRRVATLKSKKLGQFKESWLDVPCSLYEKLPSLKRLGRIDRRS